MNVPTTNETLTEGIEIKNLTAHTSNDEPVTGEETAKDNLVEQVMNVISNKKLTKNTSNGETSIDILNEKKRE